MKKISILISICAVILLMGAGCEKPNWLGERTAVLNMSALSSSAIPDTDVTYDLGDATHRWRKAYIGTLDISVLGQAIESLAIYNTGHTVTGTYSSNAIKLGVTTATPGGVWAVDSSGNESSSGTEYYTRSDLRQASNTVPPVIYENPTLTVVGTSTTIPFQNSPVTSYKGHYWNSAGAVDVAANFTVGYGRNNSGSHSLVFGYGANGATPTEIFSMVGNGSAKVTGSLSNAGLITTVSGLGTNPGLNVYIDNTTAATAGVPVQVSPGLDLMGRTWETTGPSSKTNGFRMYSKGVSGATAGSRLTWGYTGDGTVTFTDVASLDNFGTVSTTGSLLLNASSAQVGIGSSTPSYPLTVTNLGGAGNLYSAYFAGRMLITAPNEYGFGVQNTTGHGYFGVGTDNTIKISNFASGIVRMSIDSGGKVGIGTTTPSFNLQVTSATTTTSTVGVGQAGTSVGCFVSQDTDKAGFSYCTTLDGVMTCSTTSCL